MIYIPIVLLYMITGATLGYVYNEIRVQKGWGYKPQEDYNFVMFFCMILAPIALAFVCAVLIGGKIQITVKQ